MEKHKKCNKILLVFMCLMWDSATNRPIQDGYRICTPPPSSLANANTNRPIQDDDLCIQRICILFCKEGIIILAIKKFSLSSTSSPHTAPGPLKVRVHAP